MNVFAFFGASYPFERTPKEKWNTILFVSVSLSLIILLLQPFGFIPIGHFQLSIGYLFSALLVLPINYLSFPYFFPRLFEERDWTVSKAYLFLMFNFLSIGFWNHIVHSLIHKNDPVLFLSGLELSIMVLKTLIVGGAASFFFILFRYNIITRKNLQFSQDLNDELKQQLNYALHSESADDLIEVTLENKVFSFPRHKLKYISSKGNYLTFYFDEEGKKGFQMLRGRIKHMEESLKDYSEFFRCHRSFIVNIKFIESTRGNSQGLSIRLLEDSELIPVARTNIKELKLQLEKVSRSSQK